MTVGTAEITPQDILKALQEVPQERWSDILQFIQFLRYQAAIAAGEAAEEAALWAAVTAEQTYRQQHPETVVICESPADLAAALEREG